MELVVGSKIYTIPTLTARSPAAPLALTLWKDMNTVSFDANKDGTADQYFVKLMNDPVEYGQDSHSSASVADIDKDGYQDVIVTGAVNSSVGRTAVFYWNIQKNTVSAFLTQTSSDLQVTRGIDVASTGRGRYLFNDTQALTHHFHGRFRCGPSRVSRCRRSRSLLLGRVMGQLPRGRETRVGTRVLVRQAHQPRTGPLRGG